MKHRKNKTRVYNPYVTHTSSNPLGMRHLFLAIFVLFTMTYLQSVPEQCKTANCVAAVLK